MTRVDDLDISTSLKRENLLNVEFKKYNLDDLLPMGDLKELGHVSGANTHLQSLELSVDESMYETRDTFD